MRITVPLWITRVFESSREDAPRRESSHHWALSIEVGWVLPLPLRLMNTYIEYFESLHSVKSRNISIRVTIIKHGKLITSPCNRTHYESLEWSENNLVEHCIAPCISTHWRKTRGGPCLVCFRSHPAFRLRLLDTCVTGVHLGDRPGGWDRHNSEWITGWLSNGWKCVN
jgi:hypothetical protein